MGWKDFNEKGLDESLLGAGVQSAWVWGMAACRSMYKMSWKLLELSESLSSSRWAVLSSRCLSNVPSVCTPMSTHAFQGYFFCTHGTLEH